MPAKTRAPDTALEHFLREYDANGGNGTRAYLASHPRCSSRNAAAVEASKYLTRPNVQATLRELARVAAADCRRRIVEIVGIFAPVGLAESGHLRAKRTIAYRFAFQCVVLRSFARRAAKIARARVGCFRAGSWS